MSYETLVPRVFDHVLKIFKKNKCHHFLKFPYYDQTLELVFHILRKIIFCMTADKIAKL